jgi:hypothetical protein
MRCAASPTSTTRPALYWRACRDDLAEGVVEGPAQLGAEARFVEFQHARGGGFGRRPDNRTPVRRRQRQKGERPVGQEALPRDPAMGQRGPHVGDDGILRAVAFVELDAGQGTQRGIAAVTGGDDARGDLAPVTEPEGQVLDAGEQRVDDAGGRRDAALRLQRAVQGLQQVRLLDDVTERRAAAVGGVEIDRATPRTVPYVHAVIGRDARRVEARPGAGRREDASRCRRQRVGAQVPGLVMRGMARDAVDQRDARALLGEQAGEGRANHAAADDGDIRRVQSGARNHAFLSPRRPIRRQVSARLSGGSRSQASSAAPRATFSGAKSAPNSRARPSEKRTVRAWSGSRRRA